MTLLFQVPVRAALLYDDICSTTVSRRRHVFSGHVRVPVGAAVRRAGVPARALVRPPGDRHDGPQAEVGQKSLGAMFMFVCLGVSGLMSIECGRGRGIELKETPQIKRSLMNRH